LHIHALMPRGNRIRTMGERTKQRSSNKSTSPPALKFFPGMAWPVPVAFAAAISAMRFEQGDVLYRDPGAYQGLEGNNLAGQWAIQVLLPKRSARVSLGEADADRRESSWQGEVTLDLIDLEQGTSERRVVTQGKLATALFRGDQAWLDPEADDPPLPRSARELQQCLDQTRSSFDAKQTARRGCRFIFVVDLASDASRIKAAGVEEALRATGAVERIELSPSAAGIDEASAYHPTAVVRCLVMPDRTAEAVLPALRSRLYGGASSESTGDRFTVGRHGLLQSIPSEPSATTRPKSSPS
jgi:hypothetical protein